MAIFSLKHLYTNTVLDGYVILCVCLFAIETHFPLSNFQTKHIFGILMVLQKYENNLGRHRLPNFFFTAADSVPDGVLKVPSFGAADAPQFFLATVSQMGTEGSAPPEDEGDAVEGSCFAGI